MTFDAQITFLEIMCAVLSGLLAMALTIALLAVIEARRWRLIAAAHDPLLTGTDDVLPAGVRRLVDWLQGISA